MKIYNLIECWGNSPGEVTVRVYTDEKKATKAFSTCIEAYLDGSDRDAEAEVKEALKDGVFTHSDGFISLEEDTPA